jgi:hypothetical protein
MVNNYDRIKELDFEFISRFRDDADLKYLFLGTLSEKKRKAT